MDTNMTLVIHVALEIDLRKELLHFFSPWSPAITILKVLVYTLVGTDKSLWCCTVSSSSLDFLHFHSCLPSPVSELGVPLKNTQQWKFFYANLTTSLLSIVGHVWYIKYGYWILKFLPIRRTMSLSEIGVGSAKVSVKSGKELIPYQFQNPSLKKLVVSVSLECLLWDSWIIV